jgi:predicted membrane-bound spermidine synthase
LPGKVAADLHRSHDQLTLKSPALQSAFTLCGQETAVSMNWYFAFFFISGFCSILYELVWLRLTMAQFGVTTPLVSIVLSMFMAGLGIGSWVAGALVRRYGGRVSFPPLRLYAVAEFLIGTSALAVPLELRWGHHFVERMAGGTALSSGAHYLASGTLVALIVIPWCACMGATIPLAMFAIGRDSRYETRRSFSFLYLSNVVGAVAGAIIPLFLIELSGFHGTLRFGALLNAAIAASAFGLTLVRHERGSATAPTEVKTPTPVPGQRKGAPVLLFLTGLSTMGMEVIWIRLFTPYVGTLVYSFAIILVSYLLATFFGSKAYRESSRSRDPDSRLAWIMLAPLGLLPLLTSDPRLPLPFGAALVWLGVAPFAGVVGFLTPMLVDRWSGGDPDRAGRAYAVNVLGCILGPLLSGFLLLPLVGEHIAMLLLVLPWLVMAGLRPEGREPRLSLRPSAYVIVAAALAVFFLTKDFETLFPQRQVMRDSTATVIATGDGMQKQLLTNGIGMTALSPTTKMMAHLTLASLEQPPRNALIICFGMGTTHRSVISWGIPATSVELVPSVPRLFSYFHNDGAKILASPLSHLVIDDGRRYLERSPQKYDAIIIDPPPPVEAAASSLLYSEEFYAVAKERLQPGGILQQWLPWGDRAVLASVARALKSPFSYVRVFRSVEGWGWHFLASMRPIPARNAEDLVARLPPGAIVDLMEWGPAKTPTEQFERVLSTETTTGQLIALSPSTPALQDDRPINEYYLLRMLGAGWANLWRTHVPFLR